MYTSNDMNLKGFWIMILVLVIMGMIALASALITLAYWIFTHVSVIFS